MEQGNPVTRRSSVRARALPGRQQDERTSYNLKTGPQSLQLILAAASLHPQRIAIVFHLSAAVPPRATLALQNAEHQDKRGCRSAAAQPAPLRAPWNSCAVHHYLHSGSFPTTPLATPLAEDTLPGRLLGRAAAGTASLGRRRYLQLYSGGMVAQQNTLLPRQDPAPSSLPSPSPQAPGPSPPAASPRRCGCSIAAPSCAMPRGCSSSRAWTSPPCPR
jgi:hypothetical protein